MDGTHYVMAGGLRLPRVTHIIRAVHGPHHYRGDGTAMAYGSVVHQDTLLKQPHYPESTAWAAWARHYQTLAVELTVESRKIGYAGTLDRFMLIRGELWLIDLKTGSIASWHQLQLNFYDLAACEMGVRADRLGAVYLNGVHLVLRQVNRRWADVIETARRYAAKGEERGK